MADEIVVQRSQRIDADPAEVFSHIVDLHNWSQWAPWDELDPEMEKSFFGDAGAVGSGYSWTGNRKVGEGKMTVTAVDAPNGMSLDLQFLKPFKDQSVTDFVVTPVGDGSDVMWKMTTENTLMKKIMGFFKSLDAMVGPDFEKGLSNLKRVVEA